MKSWVSLSAIAVLAAGLAACGGGSGGSTTVVVTPPQVSPQAKFGSKFDADFHAESSATPASVSSGDIVPVDPAATPSSVN